MTRRWAVIPIKHAAKSKQRLAHILDPVERQQLTLVMLHDVLNILCNSDWLSGVLVATRSPKVRRLAQELGAEIFKESANANHSMAVSQACMYLCSNHLADTVMVLPGDIPCITAEDIETLIGNHDRITLVPDVRGEGTNGIIATPPDAIAFKFGKQSLRWHSDSASERGILAQIRVNKNVSLDIDYPDDLAHAVAQLPVDRSETRRFLEESGIAERLVVSQCTRGTDAN